jgi:hypothetical protein
MCPLLLKKRIAVHVSFSEDTKETTHEKTKKKPSGVRKRDIDYFQNCISSGELFSRKNAYPQALQQFTLIINAAGASHEMKAKAYAQRAEVYRKMGNQAKANHDLEFSLQLKNTGLK